MKSFNKKTSRVNKNNPVISINYIKSRFFGGDLKIKASGDWTEEKRIDLMGFMSATNETVEETCSS